MRQIHIPEASGKQVSLMGRGIFEVTPEAGAYFSSSIWHLDYPLPGILVCLMDSLPAGEPEMVSDRRVTRPFRGGFSCWGESTPFPGTYMKDESEYRQSVMHPIDSTTECQPTRVFELIRAAASFDVRLLVASHVPSVCVGEPFPGSDSATWHEKCGRLKHPIDSSLMKHSETPDSFLPTAERSTDSPRPTSHCRGTNPRKGAVHE